MEDENYRTLRDGLVSVYLGADVRIADGEGHSLETESSPMSWTPISGSCSTTIRTTCVGLASRSIGDDMSQTNYEQLITEALAEVDSGGQHPCGTTEYCCEMGGCPRCFRGIMRGEIGIEHVEVFPQSSIVRITTEGCGHPTPCTISFRGVSVTVHK
jgi:hypothetical protein